MRRLRQLPGVWGLVLLVMGDIAVAIIAYELAWHIRTLSSFGIFEALLPTNALTTIPHNYGMVVLSQVFLLWIVGLYKVNREVKEKRQGKNCQRKERIGKIFLPIGPFATATRYQFLFLLFQALVQ